MFEVMGMVLFGISYFIPTGVAGMRGHPNSVAIFVLNLFLGWTGIGWVVALVWACMAIEKKTEPLT